MSKQPQDFPEIENRILAALWADNPKHAIELWREIEPDYGEPSKAPNSLFGLRFDTRLQLWVMKATPPQLDRFSAEVQKGIRILGFMQFFNGGERRSECWIPQDIEWPNREEPIVLSRMCRFWAQSAVDMENAKGLGCTQKRVLAKNQSTGSIYDRCSYCASLRDKGFISLDDEFEPGIKFPPFRGCIHTKCACRCMVEYVAWFAECANDAMPR